MDNSYNNSCSGLFVFKRLGGLALWFIPVMFFASILSRLYYLINSKGGRLTFLLLCVLVGTIFSFYRICLPWSISTVPYATFLIILGSYLKRFESKILKPNIIFVLSSSLVVFAISQFFPLDMAWNNILPIGLITFNAVLGTLMLMNFSLILEQRVQFVSRLLIYIGRETYLILAFSQVIIMCINKYASICPFFKYCLLILILIVLAFLKSLMKDFLIKKSAGKF